MSWGVFVSVGVFSLLFALDKLRVGKKNIVKRSHNGRDLGLLERWYSAHTNLYGDRKICYFVSLEGKPPSIELITEAMINVALKHNGLRCQVINEHKNEEPRQIFWETVFPYSNDHPWVNKVFFQVEREDESTTPKLVHKLVNEKLFPENLPPWRIYLVSNIHEDKFEIVFFINHLVADGISGVIICRELLSKLRELQDPTNTYKYHINDDSHLAIEDIVDTRPSFFFLSSHLFKNFLETKFNSIMQFFGKKSHTFLPLVENENSYTDLAAYDRLSVDITKKLLSRCKEEKISFHSLFCVVSHIALAKFENNHYSVRYTKFFLLFLK